jgi:hypothetical protein
MEGRERKTWCIQDSVGYRIINEEIYMRRLSANSLVWHLLILPFSVNAFSFNLTKKSNSAGVIHVVRVSPCLAALVV